MGGHGALTIGLKNPDKCPGRGSGPSCSRYIVCTKGIHIELPYEAYIIVLYSTDIVCIDLVYIYIVVSVFKVVYIAYRIHVTLWIAIGTPRCPPLRRSATPRRCPGARRPSSSIWAPMSRAGSSTMQRSSSRPTKALYYRYLHIYTYIHIILYTYIIHNILYTYIYYISNVDTIVPRGQSPVHVACMFCWPVAHRCTHVDGTYILREDCGRNLREWIGWSILFLQHVRCRRVLGVLSL